jgi:hypothetical protein
MITFKIIFDNGKAYEVIANSEEDLKAELKSFYDYTNGEGDAQVLNSNGEDISETQFIQEIIEEIIK